MTTWLTDIVRTTNERLLSDADLTRVAEYYATVPARLRLGEELERLEPNLVKPFHAELAKRFPDRGLYTRRLAQDLVEGLRHLNLSVLADEPKLLKRRWTSHLTRAAVAQGVAVAEVRDAYAVLRELLEAKLTKSAWEVAQPAYDDLLDSLTAA